jgi:hypothetical protein
MAVPVTVEWALWGKDLGRGGYRVLACSAGFLSEENFAELIYRFSPGLLSKLPQVTISWIPGSEPYLAIAFHDDDALGWRDGDGRAVRPIRYFCVPFSELSAGPVSYQAMYEGFYGVVLRDEEGWAVPKEDRSLIQTELNAQLPGPHPDWPAVRVAALLLTGTRVRIVGAEGRELSERLRFLDDVASLLPYGMRSQLSCATWVSSTSSEHRFRLFFSHRGDEPRVPEVAWDDNSPGLIGDPVADDYAVWLLEDVPERVELLAGMTRPMNIGSRDDIHRFLEMLDRDFPGTAQLAEHLADEARNLDKIVPKLATFDTLIRRLNLDARLEREVRNVLAAIDEALQRGSSRRGISRARGIRGQHEAVGQLADLASYASRLVEEVRAALLAQYEASLRELRNTENRLAALNALVPEEGLGDELGRDTAILSAETERAINASNVLRELLAQADPDLAALEEVMLRPSALASRAQQMTGRLSAELRRFSVSLHYPKLLCPGFSSSFLVQIYPPHRQQAVVARVKDVFGDPVPAEMTRKARFQVGTKVRIRLSSPVMEFSHPVGKVISSTDTHTTFTGKPKPSTPPGVHAAVLAVSDERGEEELLSMPFEMNIVDYAFDHVSRPFAGRVIGGIVGVASVCVLALAFITRTAQVLDAAGGAVGLALSAFFFTRVETVFRRPAVMVEGSAQSPPPE